jgi:tetratricopeptide (TPR) repeat protein
MWQNMPTISVDQALHLAAQYHRSGNIAAAEEICRQVLTAMGEHRGALHLLGYIAISTGRHADAVQWFTRAAAQFPPSAGHQCDVGVAYRILGQPEEAVIAFQKALEIDANYAVAWSNLSDTLLRLGRLDEAIVAGQRAVAAQPDLAEGHSNLGNALRDKGRLDEAVEHFHRSIAINPTFPEAHNNLAYAYIEMHRWDDAIASCNRALELQPGMVKAYLNRGTASMGKCDAVQAQDSFRRALAGEPGYADAHWNLAIALLLDGKYEEGWREFEWRSRSSIRSKLGGLVPDTNKLPWDGTPMEGQTILVYAEQGLGDVIQFARYLPLVREHARARRVVFLCLPALAPLLEQSGGWDAEIIARGRADAASLPDFDRHVALLSLPLVLQKSEPQPMATPYLQADTEKRARWRERLGIAKRTRIGIAWKGNPKHVDDRRRSIDPRLLLPLLQVPNVDFYSLQIEMPGTEPPTGAPEGIIDLTTHISDFADTAAFIAELDLVISVDTATAHVAGALGRPVWTLLPFSPDWRWRLGSESTPWYPTMRLFRQKATGAWEEVIQRVTAELAKL